MWGGTELSGKRQELEDSILPERSADRSHCSLSGPSPTEPPGRGHYLRLHQPGLHCLTHPGDSLRPSLSQLSGPPKLFPVHYPYKWPGLTHALDLTKICQTSSIWPQCVPYLSLSGPTPGTSSIWPWLLVWPLLGTSKLSRSSSHLQVAL